MPVPATESAHDQVIAALEAQLLANLDGDDGVYTDMTDKPILDYYIGVYDLLGAFPAIVIHDNGTSDDPNTLTGMGGNHFNVVLANFEIELIVQEIEGSKGIGTKINRLVADFQRAIYKDHTLGGVAQTLFHDRITRFRWPEKNMAGAVASLFVQYRVYRDDPYTLQN